MNLTFVDFAALTPRQLTTAAGVLRDALWRAPSGYQGPGEAEAMVDERFADRDWFGFAALDDGAVEAGPVSSAPIHMRGNFIRWPLLRNISGAASALLCWRGPKRARQRKVRWRSISARTMSTAARICSAAICFPVC